MTEPASSEIYTLSLHDALPILRDRGWEIYKTNIDAQMRNAIYGYLAESEKQAKAAYMREVVVPGISRLLHRPSYDLDRKSTRLNSSHMSISYAVFCLKKKNKPS